MLGIVGYRAGPEGTWVDKMIPTISLSAFSVANDDVI